MLAAMSLGTAHVVASPHAMASAGSTKTFVLVHNGFAGGWVWADTMSELRRAGHHVHAPTLTGLGERAHLARPEVDLSTHIQDVVGLIECEALSGVVLVGSSSSAMVVAGVAERMPDRIARLVYVDTIEPRDGQSWFDAITPAVAAPLQAIADKHGQGWRVPRTDVQAPRWVAHPLRTVTQPLARRSERAARIPRSYVHATAKPENWFFGLGQVIDAFAAKVRADGWDYHAIASDHLPQLSQAKALAGILGALQRT
jgi:pimeloyl-ACP methyl ester carboxylesterase